MTETNRLLKFLVIFITIFFSCISHLAYAAIKEKENERDVSDIIKGLSDDEIELALSDLSLDDLKTLNQLIDSNSKNDYIYEDDIPVLDNTGVNLNGNDYFNEDYKNDDNSINPPDPIALHNFKYMPQDELNALAPENPRPKREDHQTQQTDEDYIKQLDFSFPQDLDQNHADVSGLQKDHIRVKRD